MSESAMMESFEINWGGFGEYVARDGRTPLDELIDWMQVSGPYCEEVADTLSMYRRIGRNLIAIQPLQGLKERIDDAA